MAATDGPRERDRSGRATVGSANACERGITQQFGAFTSQRRIRHDRYALALAPWQHVTLDAAIAEAVGDLVGGAAVAFWYTEQLVHVADLEVGHAPRANFPLRAQAFKRGDDAGEAHDPLRPVQRVATEMMRAEAAKARPAAGGDAAPRHMGLPDLGDQEDTITLTGNRPADEFLGPVQLRRVDQRHPERKACAQRFFLSR